MDRRSSDVIGEPVAATGSLAGKNRVSIVIPVGHQSDPQRLRSLVSAVDDVLKRANRDHEFVLVDDASPDTVAAELARLKADFDGLTVIRLHQGLGESVALSAGFEEASGDYFVTMAPYIQVEPEDILKVLARLDEGYDFVAGWRHPRVDPILNRIQSSVFNFLAGLFTRARYHDLNCTLRAMRRKVPEEIQIYGDQFRFFPILAERQGFKIAEVQVRHREELGKVGYFGVGAYVRRMLDLLTMFFLIKFTKKPLRFFGLVGAVFFIVGVGVCLYLTYERLFIPSTTGLADRPLLILGVLLIVVGVQTVSIGLIGEIIIFTHAKSIKEYRIEKVIE